MLWEELTWPEIADVDRNTPVVLPFAACEQHGHHLPLFVDTIQVTAIAREAERRLREHMLLVPTVWLGASHHHLDFPGTLSLRPSLFTEVVKSVAECVLKAGFRRLIFLNGHGGNHTPIAQALTQLVGEDDRADDACLVLASWWESFGRKAREAMSTPKMTHACEYETSLMLALRPDLVKMDRIREAEQRLSNDWVRSENEHASRVAVFHRFRRWTAAGSMGRPSAATRDKGDRLMSEVCEDFVRLLRDILDWPALDAIGPEA